MAEGVDIGALSGRIEFEDNVTSTMDLILKKIDQLEGGFDSLGGHVASSAAGFFTAEVALNAVNKAMEFTVDVLKDMSVEGAGMGDIEENFLRLNRSAGRLADTLLNELREGTHNTIDDLELMKMVNEDMTMGLDMTDQEWRTLADGAFAIAQARGEEVGKVLNTLNEAMQTGRTRSLALLTGKIDLAKAESDLAARYGETTDKLSTEAKLQASRIAILDSVTKATERLGQQTDGVDEIVGQISTSFANLWDKLSIGVATSPNVVQAFTTVRDTLIETFGGDSQDLVATFVGWVNNIADKVTEYAPIVIKGFVAIKDWVVDVYTTVRAGWDTLPDWFKNTAGGALLAAAGFSALSMGASAATGGVLDLGGTLATITSGMKDLPELLANTTRGLNMAWDGAKTLAGGFTSLRDARAAVGLLTESVVGALGPLGTAGLLAGAFMAAWEIGKMQPVSDFFEKLGLRLQGFSAEEADLAVKTGHALDAQQAQAEVTKKQADAVARAKEMMAELTAATNQTTNSTRGVNAVLERNQAILGATDAELKKRKEAMEEIQSSGKTWQETVKGIDKEIQETVKNYLAAGVAQDKLATAYGLTATQVKALATSLKEEQDALKVSEKAATDSAKRWSEYYALIREMSGTATDQQISEIERWKAAQIKAHVDAKTDTADFYSWLRSMENAKNEFATQKRLEQDEHSRAHLEREKARKRDEYEFALANAHQFTAAWIEQLRIQSEAAARAAENWQATLGGAIQKITEKVRTLSGEMITLEERQRRQTSGGAIDFEGREEMTQEQLNQIHEWIKAQRHGFSQAELQLFVDQMREGSKRQEAAKKAREEHEQKMAAFSQSREEEDEPMITPRGMSRGGTATRAGIQAPRSGSSREGVEGAVFNIYVNGTAADVSRKVGDEIMRRLKLGRKFGSA